MLQVKKWGLYIFTSMCLIAIMVCVDSRKAYDTLAKAIECIHDVFFVCFCTRHR